MMNINDIETSNRESEITRGTVTFDGTGSWNFTGQVFDSNGTSVNGTGSGTYSVKSDGSYTITDTSETPNLNFIGYISEDDSISVFGSGGKVGGEVKSKAMPWIPLLLDD